MKANMELTGSFTNSFIGSFGRVARAAAPVATAVLLAACADQATVYEYPDDSGRRGSGDFYAQEGEAGTLFGKGGIDIFGGDRQAEPESGGGIAVNVYLWRASLDTISFLPLVSADPFGGVIITDWYSAPETPDERTKVQVYILDRQLRSDGLRVSVFRERLVDDHWVAQPVSDRTARTIEDNILAQARELRFKLEIDV